MNEKEISRSITPIIERDEKRETVETPTESFFNNISINDNNIQEKINQSLIAKFLQVNEENAITTDELVNITGISDTRVIRKFIEAERRNDIVICASKKGYFLPERDENGILTLQGFDDVQRYFLKSSKTAVSTFQTIQSAKRAMRVYANKNQISFADIGKDSVYG